MSRGSFGRTVARAAASGGGRAYRARPAVGWYATIVLICAVGLFLIVYSRGQNIKAGTPKPAEGPSASVDWTAAIAFDICGQVQPNLPVNSNLASTGLRTFGDGLIKIQPNAVLPNGKPASFEGAKATLQAFITNYPKLTITTTSFQLPKGKLYKAGTSTCGTLPKNATAAQKKAAEGVIKVKVWASPTARGRVQSGTNPLAVHLTNGEMITVGFVTNSAVLPQPPSRSALIAATGATGATGTSGASGASGASGTS